MYENLVIISTYQDINSGPLQIQEHVKSHRFKEWSGKWDPVTTAYLVNHAWCLEKNYLTRIEGDICTNIRDHVHSEEKINVLDTYITPKKN